MITKTTHVSAEAVRIVDMGDADIVHTDTEEPCQHRSGVRAILDAGALPVALAAIIRSTSLHQRALTIRGHSHSADRRAS